MRLLLARVDHSWQRGSIRTWALDTKRNYVSSTLLNNLLAQARRKSKAKPQEVFVGVLFANRKAIKCCNSPVTVAAVDQGQRGRALSLSRIERRKQTTPLRQGGLIAYQLVSRNLEVLLGIAMYPAVPSVGRQTPVRTQIASRSACCCFGP